MTEPAAAHADPAEARLVCAVLAAQVTAIRDRIEGDQTVALLGQAQDALKLLADLVRDLPTEPVDNPVAARRARALAVEAELSQTIDGFAFGQAQRQDFTRQMADGVVVALERLAADSSGRGIAAHELLDLYVSEEQRHVHDSALARAAAAGWSTPAQGNAARRRQGPEA